MVVVAKTHTYIPVVHNKSDNSFYSLPFGNLDRHYQHKGF